MTPISLVSRLKFIVEIRNEKQISKLVKIERWEGLSRAIQL
jgi:hypothetical protein